MSKYIFTSESVTEGHPDKICDQISDAILDAYLVSDPSSRVAVETFTTTGQVIIGGEVTSKGYVDAQKIARQVLEDIGYTNSAYGHFGRAGFPWEKTDKVEELKGFFA